MARAQIGELAVQGAPPGAEVVVNGRVVGALPLPSPVKLPARTTEVVVRAPGHSERREMVPIAGGQRHALTVKLEKVKTPAARAGRDPATPVALRRAHAGVRDAVAPLAVQDRPAGRGESRSGAANRGVDCRRRRASVAGAPASPCKLAARSKAAEIRRLVRDSVRRRRDRSPERIPSTSARIAWTPWESYRRWSIVGYVSGAALARHLGRPLLGPPALVDAANRAHAAQLACAPTPERPLMPGVRSDGLRADARPARRARRAATAPLARASRTAADRRAAVPAVRAAAQAARPERVAAERQLPAGGNGGSAGTRGAVPEPGQRRERRHRRLDCGLRRRALRCSLGLDWRRRGVWPGRTTDASIAAAFDGRNWGSWAATSRDSTARRSTHARTSIAACHRDDTIHLVATGLNPIRRRSTRLRIRYDLQPVRSRAPSA